MTLCTKTHTAVDLCLLSEDAICRAVIVAHIFQSGKYVRVKSPHRGVARILEEGGGGECKVILCEARKISGLEASHTF